MLEINAKLSDLLPVVPYFKRDEQGQVINNEIGDLSWRDTCARWCSHRWACGQYSLLSDDRMKRLITDYGLFEVSADDLESAPTQAPARECVPEQVPGQVPGQTCAGVPLLTISDEMDKRKNKKERESGWRECACAHTRG